MPPSRSPKRTRTSPQTISPHRAVPLSEGRLDVDAADPSLRNLACAYHGFRWRADGACVAVPQAVTPAAEAKACASPRLCAQVFPTAARSDGLLWVWATPGDFETAAATPPGAHALLDAPDDLVFITPWYARDIPCEVAEFGENTIDPSHVAFSHHRILGSRYSPPWQAMAPAGRPVVGHKAASGGTDAVAEAEDAGGFAVKVALLGMTRPKVRQSGVCDFGMNALGKKGKRKRANPFLQPTLFFPHRISPLPLPSQAPAPPPSFGALPVKYATTLAGRTAT